VIPARRVIVATAQTETERIAVLTSAKTGRVIRIIHQGIAGARGDQVGAPRYYPTRRLLLRPETRSQLESATYRIWTEWARAMGYPAPSGVAPWATRQRTIKRKGAGSHV
jgi:hypothetical protein